MRIDNMTDVGGMLGEIKMFALSETNAFTKATLQGKGWAICDGTTPAAQGVINPILTVTPDMTQKFLRMSNNESSGASGGSEIHGHKWATESGGVTFDISSTSNARTSGSFDGSGNSKNFIGNNTILDDEYWTDQIDTKPPYFEVVYFMKVA